MATLSPLPPPVTPKPSPSPSSSIPSSQPPSSSSSPSSSSVPPSSSSVPPSSSSVPPSSSSSIPPSSSSESIPPSTSSTILPSSSISFPSYSFTYPSITIATQSVTASPSAIGSGSHAKPFFENKGAVAGVFTVVGLAATAIAAFLLITVIKRHKARQFDREVAAAAADANLAGNTRFEDEYDEGYSPSGGYSSGTHGAYSNQPMSQAHYQPYYPPTTAAYAYNSHNDYQQGYGQQQQQQQQQQQAYDNGGYVQRRTSHATTAYTNNSNQSPGVAGFGAQMARSRSQSARPGDIYPGTVPTSTPEAYYNAHNLPPSQQMARYPSTNRGQPQQPPQPRARSGGSDYLEQDPYGGLAEEPETHPPLYNQNDVSGGQPYTYPPQSPTNHHALVAAAGLTTGGPGPSSPPPVSRETSHGAASHQTRSTEKSIASSEVQLARSGSMGSVHDDDYALRKRVLKVANE